MCWYETEKSCCSVLPLDRESAVELCKYAKLHLNKRRTVEDENELIYSFQIINMGSARLMEYGIIISDS